MNTYNCCMMKMRILPHQIRRITQDRYSELHRQFLNVDVRPLQIEPIHRGVYYVDARHPMGKQLIAENTPAKCIYRTGEIYCLYDERIPLTEARLVHEFVHRAARRRILFVWSSGLDMTHHRTMLNEVLTEYLTMCILGDRYEAQTSPHNQYRPKLSAIAAIEEKTGRIPLVKAYLAGDIRFFQKHKTTLRGILTDS